MVWYFHLFKNFPQFIVIHRVKGFGIVNAEIDVFLELFFFLSFFFFFLLQKALLFPFGPRLERGLQDVKKLPSSCREGLQAALMLGGFFKGHWSPEVPSRA